MMVKKETEQTSAVPGDSETAETTKHALVIEGGAMRGIFAAGVLDGFIDHNYNPFDFCIGVSASAT
jgi:predicted patatin/cPLA2 family phospholipase